MKSIDLLPIFIAINCLMVVTGFSLGSVKVSIDDLTAAYTQQAVKQDSIETAMMLLLKKELP